MTTNDYKANASRSSTGAGSRGAGRGMNPMFLGVIIGLLLGIVMALGVAVWIGRSSSSFQEKSKPVDALPTIAPKPSIAPVSALPTDTTTKTAPPAGANTTTKSGAEKPRFEFYDILPGDKTGKDTGKTPPAAAKSADKPAADPKRDNLAAKPAEAILPASSDKESYFLQAGAFQNESDAENMKAQVAFAGMEAFVRGVNLPGKGTLYRVRLGPYKSLEEVNRIKAALSQNSINAAVVKAE